RSSTARTRSAGIRSTRKPAVPSSSRSGTSTPWSHTPATRAANRCAEGAMQRARREFIQQAIATAAIAALAPPALCAAPSPSRSHARVRGGRVAGTREGGVHVFRGLGYGADTGPRRFLPPVREPVWRGMRDASTFGASAPQRGREGPGSEDCLFLNVWTPALRDGGR